MKIEQHSARKERPLIFEKSFKRNEQEIPGTKAKRLEFGRSLDKLG